MGKDQLVFVSFRINRFWRRYCQPNDRRSFEFQFIFDNRMYVNANDNVKYFSYILQQSLICLLHKNNFNNNAI